MTDPISNFGAQEQQGRPIYDPNAGKIDEELRSSTIFNPQYNILNANVGEISIFPRKN